MYGRHVHDAVIKAQEKESGITVHYVNEEYDKGATILQELCKVDEHETIETLEEKIRALEYFYFPKAVEKVIEELKMLSTKS
jgi:phosphoribosylglycinamide formyltransferase-1